MIRHFFLIEVSRSGEDFDLRTNISEHLKIYHDVKFLAIHGTFSGENGVSFNIPVFKGQNKVGDFVFDYKKIKETKYLRSKFEIKNEKIWLSYVAVISDPLNRPINGTRSYILPKPCIIVHRGDGNNKIREFTLENTVKAANKGFNKGANLIEFDIQLANDNTPLVMHDFYHRTKKTLIGRKKHGVDNEGNNMYFNCQVSPEEHKASGLETKYATERATFKEFFEQTNENLGFYLEVKYPSSRELENLIPFEERNIYTQRVMDEIEAYRKNKRNVFFTSFDILLQCMFAVKQSKYPVIQCINPEKNETLEHLVTRIRGLKPLFKEIGMKGYSTDPKTFDIERSLVNELHNEGFLVFTYSATRTSHNELKDNIELGVDGIIVDDVDNLKKVMSTL